MKKYLFLIILFGLMSFVLYLQGSRIAALTDERDALKRNEQVLLDGAEKYRTESEKSAAKIGELELEMSEYERRRKEDADLIAELRLKKKDVERVASVQANTRIELSGEVRDSVIYVRDSIYVNAQCVDIVDPYIELHGCFLADSSFKGDVRVYNRLVITETVKYKRFLGFLWKTKKVKSREYDVVSDNPYTSIDGFEVVRISN